MLLLLYYHIITGTTTAAAANITTTTISTTFSASLLGFYTLYALFSEVSQEYAASIFRVTELGSGCTFLRYVAKPRYSSWCNETDQYHLNSTSHEGL